MGGRYASSWANKAQITRALLLTQATAATWVPLRCVSAHSHRPCVSARRAARCTTARAPHESAVSADTDCRVSKSRLTAPCPHGNSAAAPGPTRPPGVARCETRGADRRSPPARWPSTGQSPAPPPVSGRLDASDTRTRFGASPARCALRAPPVVRTTRRRCLGQRRSIPTPRHPRNERRRAGPSPRIVL